MLAKTFLIFLAMQISLQVTVIETDEIQEGYDWLLNPQKFCENKRVAVFTDKPVYKIGETIYITVYYYNVITKSPLNKCKDNKYGSLSIVDSDDQYILNVNSNSNEKEEISDYSSFSYEQKILEDKFKGGVYKLNFNGSGTDQIKFFVLQFNNRKAGVISDWNIETIKPGDLLQGKVTLKSFTKENQFQNVTASYSFLDGSGQVLNSENNMQVVNNQINISYFIPQDIKGLLIFDVVFEADGVTIAYKKEFQEAIFDDIQIEFTIGTGKVAMNNRNNFYFTAFKGEEKIFKTQIKNARVFRQFGNTNSVVIDNVNSNEEGMGKVTFFISDDDFENGTKFFLQVQYSDFVIKNYLIYDTAEKQYSKVHLDLQKRVFEMNESIQLTLNTLDLTKNYTLLIQDKTKIYYQEEISKRSGQNFENFNINIKNLNLPNGGVYVVQVYSEVSKEVKFKEEEELRQEFIRAEEQKQRENQLKRGIAEDQIRIYPPTPREKDITFLGKIEQEVFIFIKPEFLLNANVQFDKQKYSPGDTVEFNLALDQNCANCPKNIENARAIIEVVDASAFVEVDKSSVSPSLFTKIFLEKEIYNEKNEFRNSFKYIDYLFDNNERNQLNSEEKNERLNLLLGNQKWRQFFLDPNNLQEYLSNRWDEKYSKYKDNYEYQLPSSNNFGGPIFYAQEARPVPMMMFERAAPMELQMERNIVFEGGQGAIDVAMPEPVPEPVAEENVEVDTTNQNEEKKLEDFLKQDNIFYKESSKFENNQLKGKFKLPNDIQTFRMRITLYDQNGVYGVTYKSITSKRDYNIYVEEPMFIISNEVFRVKLVIENFTNKSETFTFQKPFFFTVVVPGNGTQTYQVQLSKQNIPFEIQAFNSQAVQIANFSLNPALIQPGITINKGKSGYITTQRNAVKNRSLSYDASIPNDLIKGETIMKVCYNNPGVGLILDAIEKMNRIPTGCFEQASSTNFPLVLALQIVLSLPKTPKTIELKNKLLDNLKKGVKLLLTYETSDGGFEWFGKSPGHSTLTAYGLWQFREINNLKLDEELFDTSLLDRLKRFLGQAKNKQGGWEITRGLDALGNPPQDISDTYIAFVLSVQFQEIFDLFSDQFKKMDDYIQRFKNGDQIESYQLSLLGLYSVNKNDKETAKLILEEILKRQNQSEGYIERAETSITKSRGDSLKIETTALTIILFIELQHFEIEKLSKMIEFLTSKLNDGYFGSTQATILSLLAFEKYLTEYVTNNQQDIVFNIAINNRLVSQLRVNGADVLGSNNCSDISKDFLDFEQSGQKFEISVEPNRNYLTDQNARYLISIDHSFQQILPESTQNSPISANISKQSGSNTSIYDITLQNLEKEEQGMTIIEFNKPSCLDFNLTDLDNLRLQGAFDYFELLKDNSQIVFYFKGLRPNSRENFKFSLYKRFSLNNCEERTHEIYLYYDKKGSVLYKKAI